MWFVMQSRQEELLRSSLASVAILLVHGSIFAKLPIAIDYSMNLSFLWPELLVGFLHKIMLSLYLMQMPYLNNSFRVACGSRWAGVLGVFRGGLPVRAHLRTFSVVAFGSRWLRGSTGVIISGFEGLPSKRSSSRPSLAG